MPSRTQVQRCAALICAYLTGDTAGCEILRDTDPLTTTQWHDPRRY